MLLAAAAPLALARSALSAPSDRVRLCVVGCGVRGRQLAADLPAGTQVVATADANLPRAEALAASLGPSVDALADYRHLLDRRDIDGWVIASVDHHHAHAAALACLAGCDCYVEKPLTTYFAEGRRLVEIARRTGRVVQVGTQQRSMEADRFACQLVRDGALGDLRAVECVNYASPRPIPPGGASGAPPSGLDWDLWLGPAQRRPYEARLAAHWQDGLGDHWGSWEEYSTGQIGGLGAHALDMVQLALGTDDTGPIEFVPKEPDEAGTPRVDFRYANGVWVRLSFADQRPYRGPRLGAVFVGSKGKLEINRNRYRSNPPELAAGGPAEEIVAKWEGDGWKARPHLEDWVNAIRSRRPPIADVEIGHRTATIHHLVTIARRLGRPLRWDPVAERVVGDDEACRMLDRPRRPGWELPG